MALFLAGQGKVGRPGSGAGLLGVLVAGLPLLGAGLIAVSRTEDYRHGELNRVELAFPFSFLFLLFF